MFERFTDRARRVLVLAQEEARLLNHGFIGTEHILLGLIHEGDGLAAEALETLDISLEAVREAVEERIGPAGSAPTGPPPFTPRAKKVLELSLREALQMGHHYIGTEHMLLGIVREGEGVAAQVLIELGAELPRVRQTVVQLLSRFPTREASEGEAVGGAARLRRRRAQLAGVPVGKEWSAQVVRSGRRPEDYATAYAELADLVAECGLDIAEIDSSAITCVSVETTEGPGFMVTVRHLIEDGPPPEDPPPEELPII
jgi:ATP-dependent Clp protease ATP-binding subunit ClpC